MKIHVPDTRPTLAELAHVYGVKLTHGKGRDSTSHRGRICLGEYDDPEFRDAVFFHELGHTVLWWFYRWRPPVAEPETAPAPPKRATKRARGRRRFRSPPRWYRAMPWCLWRSFLMQTTAMHDWPGGYPASHYDDELEAWQIGLQLAAQHGYSFSDNVLVECEKMLASYAPVTPGTLADIARERAPRTGRAVVAGKILDAWGAWFRSGRSIEMRRIAEMYGVNLRFVSSEEHGDGGSVAGFEIWLSDDANPKRRMAAFFHELGHVLQGWLMAWSSTSPLVVLSRRRRGCREPPTCDFSRFFDDDGWRSVGAAFPSGTGWDQEMFRYDYEFDAWLLGIMLGRLHGFAFDDATLAHCDEWLESYIGYEKHEYTRAAYAEIAAFDSPRPKGVLLAHWGGKGGQNPTGLDGRLPAFRRIFQDWASWVRKDRGK